MEKKKQAWLVTFSDLITLLITFFTLIIAMSSMDKKVLKQSFTFFSGGPGLMEYGAETESKLVQLKKEYNLTSEDLKTIENIIKKYSLMPEQALKVFFVKRFFKHNTIEMKIINQKDILIKTDATPLFLPVSFELTPLGKKFAEGIGKTLKKYAPLCQIVCYTSKFPIETELIKNNLDLSIKRGSKLVDFLSKKNINYNKIEVMGWGSEVISKDMIEVKFLNILK